MGVGVTDVGLLLAVMQGVFSKTWVLTVPRRIVSITNSCVTVPCHFEVPDNQEANILNCSNKSFWRRGTHLSPNTAQGEIIGDLTKKNCTTVMSGSSNIHNDSYFFRLNCPKVQFTFPDAVDIITQTEPSPPQLTVMGQMSEGGQAQLQCETPVSCSVLPPSLTWSPRDASSQEESHMQQQSTDGSMIMTSTLTFIASADHHNESIICSVSYPLSNGGSSSPAATSRKLSILYAPRFTRATISPSGPVFEGETVMLMCSSDANPPVTRYTWFRDDRGKIRAIAPGQTLELQVSLLDSRAYLCQAQSPRGSQRSTSVFLAAGAIQGRSNGLVMMPYILCGVVSVLYILTVVVALYKYHSLSTRLKKIELKGEPTYTDLKTIHVNSDYDQLQPPPEVPEYENSSIMQVKVKNQPQPNRR
ncbi:myelin-associated glycoprotein [Hippoglossus stenolepis]|uniref:myelin-associated glycoprotein n=1 Tax=Hippoglossus stenolepis TaxID=195615 RepID=UPI001FAF447F|nr:myelin-associated glycoprotein [Hippoglossus stenolepis]